MAPHIITHVIIFMMTFLNVSDFQSLNHISKTSFSKDNNFFGNFITALSVLLIYMKVIGICESIVGSGNSMEKTDDAQIHQ